MKLSSKTLILIAILFAVIATAASLLAARTLYASLTDEYRSKGIAIAEGVVDSSAEILLSRDLATVQAIIDQFTEIKGVAYVFVTNGEGEIVAHTFVPAVPPEIYPLVDTTSGDAVSGEPLDQVITIKGMGEFIHIHQPILAGVAGYVHVGMDLRFIRAQILNIVIRQQLLLLVIFLVMGAVAFALVRRVSRPLTLLAEYTGSLATTDFAAGLDIPEGIKALPRRSKDEIGRLAKSFIDMETTLQTYIRELRETTATKERIESELNIAHDIQMSLVPKTFPPFPHRKEFELHATLVSAREVGGDFYDFYFIDERRLCFAIGDVSGKGVPASLFMALAKTLFRATGGLVGDLQQITAQDIMTRLNREISRDNDSCMFVTVFCGVLDTQTGELDYCNAGHNLPFLMAGEEVNILAGTGDAALGMTESSRYHSGRHTLAPGDTLVLYTDGITEAMNDVSSVFSEAELKATLLAARDYQCGALIEKVVETVREFAGGAAQSDDITLLALRYHGPDVQSASPQPARLLHAVLPGDLSALPELNRQWEALVQEWSIPSATAFRVRMAFEELVTNCVLHAEPPATCSEIQVTVDREGDALLIEIWDDGPAFDPVAAPAPDTGLALHEREPGGLGIHLVRKMMAEFSYRRDGNYNVVSLKTS